MNNVRDVLELCFLLLKKKGIFTFTDFALSLHLDVDCLLVHII